MKGSHRSGKTKSRPKSGYGGSLPKMKPKARSSASKGAPRKAKAARGRRR